MTQIPPFSEKSHLHTSSGIRTFVHVTSSNWASSIHAEHPFALEVIVIGDQLIYLEAPFYNSNFSIPNSSASSFGEAQLDCAKVRSDGTQLSPLPRSVGHKNPDALGDSSE